MPLTWDAMITWPWDAAEPTADDCLQFVEGAGSVVAQAAYHAGPVAQPVRTHYSPASTMTGIAGGPL
jgi:hypothetical protein